MAMMMMARSRYIYMSEEKLEGRLYVYVMAPGHYSEAGHF